MDRFEIINMPSGNYAIIDRDTGHYVRFGYNNPPLNVKPGDVITEWQNYYSVREFAKKLEALNAPAPRGPISELFNPIEKY
jgi:hypothetical protein